MSLLFKGKAVLASIILLTGFSYATTSNAPNCPKLQSVGSIKSNKANISYELLATKNSDNIFVLLEPRNGAHTLKLKFNQNLIDQDIKVLDRVNGKTFNTLLSKDILTVTLPNIDATGYYLSTTIKLVNSTDLCTYSITPSFLWGDVNGDGSVTTADVNLTASNAGAVNNTNFVYDVNNTNKIDSSDRLIVHKRIGAKLTMPVLPPIEPPTDPNKLELSEEIVEKLRDAENLIKNMENGSIAPLTNEEFLQTDYAKNQPDSATSARTDLAHRLAAGAIDPDPEWFSTAVEHNLLVAQPGQQKTLLLTKKDINGHSLGPVDASKLRVVVRIQHSETDIETVPDAYAKRYANLDELGHLTINVPNDLKRGRMLIGVRPQFIDPGIRALTERWSVPIFVEIWPIKEGVITLKQEDVVLPKLSAHLDEFRVFSELEIKEKLRAHLVAHNELLAPLVVNSETYRFTIGDLVNYQLGSEIIAGKVKELTDRDGQTLLLIASEWLEVFDILDAPNDVMVEHGVMPEVVVYRQGPAIPKLSEELLNDMTTVGSKERADIEQERKAILDSYSPRTRAMDARGVLADLFKSRCELKTEATLTFAVEADLAELDIKGSVAINTPLAEPIECKWTVRADQAATLGLGQYFGGPVVAILNRFFGAGIDVYPQGELYVKTSTQSLLSTIGIEFGIKSGFKVKNAPASSDLTGLNGTPLQLELKTGGDLSVQADLNLVSSGGWISRWFDLSDVKAYLKTGFGIGLAAYGANATAVYQENKDSRLSFTYQIFGEAGISTPIVKLISWFGIKTEGKVGIKYEGDIPFTDKYEVLEVVDDGAGNASVVLKPNPASIFSKASTPYGYIGHKDKSNQIFNQSNVAVTYNVEECKSGKITAPVIACNKLAMCGATEEVSFCGGNLKVTAIQAVGKVGSTVKALGEVSLGKANNPTNKPIVVELSSTLFGKIEPATLELQPGENKSFTASATCTKEGSVRGKVTAKSGALTTEADAILSCTADCTGNSCDVLWGDPHVITQDQFAYDFNASGDYVLLRGADKHNNVEVQARFLPSFDGRGTWPTAAAMNVGGDIVEIQIREEKQNSAIPLYYLVIYVNDQEVHSKNRWSTYLTTRSIALPSGGLIFIDRFFINRNKYPHSVDPSVVTVHWPTDNPLIAGYSVTVKSPTNTGLQKLPIAQINITRPSINAGKERGLLGNNDGDATNDLMRRNGQILAQEDALSWTALYGLFGADWLVRPYECLFRHGCMQADFPLNVIELTQEERQNGEMACAGLTGFYKDACIIDVGLTNLPGVVEEYYANTDDLNEMADQLVTLEGKGVVFQLASGDKTMIEHIGANLAYTQAFSVNHVSGVGSYMLQVRPPQDGSAYLLPNKTTSLIASAESTGRVEVLCGKPDPDFATMNHLLPKEGVLQLWRVNPLTGTAQTLLGEIKLSCARGIKNKILAAGLGSSLALNDENSLWSWGNNSVGQLGLGNSNNQVWLQSASFLTPLSALSTSYQHTLAIDHNQQLWAWGLNSSGQLGLGGTVNHTSPQQVVFDAVSVNIKQVATGRTHSLALDSLGQVWAWGDNALGQLGLNNTSPYATPQKIIFPESINILSITTGSDHNLAVDSSGQVWAWGRNDHGQLGLNNRSPYYPLPQKIIFPDSINILSVATGLTHSLALDSQGQLWTWGNNDKGQLGLGSGISYLTPQKVVFPASTHIELIATGTDHSLALDRLGKLWVWGGNDNGQLGLGDRTQRAIPQIVDLTFLEGAKIVELAASAMHTLILSDKDFIYGWGSQRYGSLGDGVYQDRLQVTPKKIARRSPHIEVSQDQIIIDHEGSDKENTIDIGNIDMLFDPLNLSKKNQIKISTAGIAFGNTQSTFSLNKGSNWLSLNLDTQLICQSAGKKVVPLIIIDQNDKVILNKQLMISCSMDVQYLVALTDTGLGQVALTNFEKESYQVVFTGENNVLVNGSNSWTSELCSECMLSFETDQLCRATPNMQLGTINIYDKSSLLVDHKVLYCPLAATTVNPIAVGKDHALVIDTRAKVWSLGYGRSGELGRDYTVVPPDGDAIPLGQPLGGVDFPVGLSFKSIAANIGYSLAIDSSGQLWGWGSHYGLMLGLAENTESIKKPQRGLFDAAHAPELISVAAGVEHALALDIQGQLWDFGYLYLGNINPTIRYEPRMVIFPQPTKIIAMAVAQHNLAIDEQGKLWAWGDNQGGQLGIGHYEDKNLPQPVLFPAGTPSIKSVSASPQNSLAVDSTGQVWTWGLDSEVAPSAAIPHKIRFPQGSPPIIAVSAGSYMGSLALDNQGQVWRLVGKDQEPEVMFKGKNIPRIVAIANNSDFSLAMDTKGHLWGWGWGPVFGLGGSEPLLHTPVRLSAETLGFGVTED